MHYPDPQVLEMPRKDHSANQKPDKITWILHYSAPEVPAIELYRQVANRQLDKNGGALHSADWQLLGSSANRLVAGAKQDDGWRNGSPPAKIVLFPARFCSPTGRLMPFGASLTKTVPVSVFDQK